MRPALMIHVSLLTSSSFRMVIWANRASRVRTCERAISRYPQLARGLYSSQKHNNRVNQFQFQMLLLLLLFFPFSPCSRKRLIKEKGLYDHSQKPLPIIKQWYGKSSYLVCMFSRSLSAHLCTCKFPYSKFLARDCSVCYLCILIKNVQGQGLKSWCIVQEELVGGGWGKIVLLPKLIKMST